jgi:hypothetical protein
MKRNTIVALAVLVIGFTVARPAFADHYIYSLVVEEGVLELETRLHRDVDHSSEKDDAQTQIYEIAYGVNSWWHTALFANLDKQPAESLKYSATAWENIFQLTPQGKYWLDAGFYLEYARATRDQPDEIETKLLLEKTVYPLVLTTNLIFNRQIGRNAETGTGFEYASRVNWPWKREVQFGVEAFGEPGRFADFNKVTDQHHVVGPVASGRFNIPGVTGNFGYQAGYLFGITAASPQGEVKGTLEYEIPL